MRILLTLALALLISSPCRAGEYFNSYTNTTMTTGDEMIAYRTGTGMINVLSQSMGTIGVSSINVNSGGAISSLLTGNYAPTRSAEANLDSNVTPSTAQYMRLGDMVIVMGNVTTDPTTTLTSTSFELTLPVASNIGAVADVSGSGSIGTQNGGTGVHVFGVAGNDTVKFQWVPTPVTSQIITYIYMYKVI